MDELLDGLVPGLPDDAPRADPRPRRGRPALRGRDGAHAARPRRCSSATGDVYRPTGAIEALDVPETLHALIAARLDGLEPEERRLLQDAAVLGKIVHEGGPRRAVRLPERRSSSRVLDVARPQGGAVAPGRSALAGARPVRLPPGPRPARRLRDAREARAEDAPPRGGRVPRPGVGAGEQEIAEVIAAHYLDAYGARPTPTTRPRSRRRRCEMLARAGERAASLRRTRRRSATSSEPRSSPTSRRRGRRCSSEPARPPGVSGRQEEHARSHERALELYETEGLTHPRRPGLRSARGGRVAARAARARRSSGWSGPSKSCPATSRTRTWRRSQPSSDVCTSSGARSISPQRRIDTAIEIAESLWLPEVLSQAPQHAGPDRRLRRALGAVARAVQARARARARARPHCRGPARVQQPRRPARPAGPVRGGDRAAAAGARARAEGRLPRERVAPDRRVERLPVPDRPVDRGAGARSGGSRGTAQPNRDCRCQHADFAGRRAR